MNQKNKKRMQYKKEFLIAALKAVESGLSINAASAKFQIPRSILHSKVIGKYSNKKPGPVTILPPAQEALLTEWIFLCSDRGYPVTKMQLLNSVRMLVNEMGIKNPFNGNQPGRSWYEGFLRRHKDVRTRITENVSLSRASMNESSLRKWFFNIEMYLKEKELFNIDSSRVFNTDETALLLNPKATKVLTIKGNKNVYNIVNNNEKESLTVLMAGNASGQLAPPLILFSYQRIPTDIYNKMPNEWSYGRSDNGWMTGKNFYEYVANVFHPWLIKTQIPLPVILYVDGHASHLTQPLSEFCFKNNIELISLHPNSTHIIQPMDQSMFGPLKSAWKKQVDIYRKENNLLSVNKSDVGVELKKALETLNIGRILKNGFQACELYPFSASAVNYSKIFKRMNKQEQTNEQSLSSVQKSSSIHSCVLKYIEEKIDQTTLAAFQDASDKNEWTGEEKDTNLFYLWNDLTKTVRVEAEGIHSETSINPKSTLQFTTDMQSQEENVADVQLNTSLNTAKETINVIIIQGDDSAQFVTNPASNINYNFTINEDDIIIEEKNTSIQNSSSENVHNDEICTSTNNIKTVISESNSHSIIEESVCEVQKTLNIQEPLHNIQNRLNENSVIQLENMTISNLYNKVPSPFKKCLLWPKEDKYEKKKSLKDKIPSVLTSELGRQWLQEKENKKRKLEEDKQMKKKIRLEKMLIKKEKDEEKNRKKIEKEKQIKEKSKKQNQQKINPNKKPRKITIKTT